jgi:hemolysin activation/secretion protein
VKLHGFVDGAVLRELSPLPGTASAYELASLGLGLRLRADHGGIVTMDLAWPTKESTQQRAWSPRLQASTSLSF